MSLRAANENGVKKAIPVSKPEKTVIHPQGVESR